MRKSCREELRGDGRNQAIKVSRADAEGDQREHVGAAVDHGRPGPLEERPAAPKNNRRRQSQLHPVHRRHVSRWCSGLPGSMSPIARRKTGRLRARPTQKRRLMSANSGFGAFLRRDGARLQGHAAGQGRDGPRTFGNWASAWGPRPRDGRPAARGSGRRRLRRRGAAKVVITAVMNHSTRAVAGSTVMPQPDPSGRPPGPGRLAYGLHRAGRASGSWQTSFRAQVSPMARRATCPIIGGLVRVLPTADPEGIAGEAETAASSSFRLCR